MEHIIKNFDRKIVVGVEPCKNLAEITRKKKYKTYTEYWSTSLARTITKKKKADLVYSANTLSHIKNFNEIFKAIENRAFVPEFAGMFQKVTIRMYKKCSLRPILL